MRRGTKGWRPVESEEWLVESEERQIVILIVIVIVIVIERSDIFHMKHGSGFAGTGSLREQEVYSHKRSQKAQIGKINHRGPREHRG